MDMRQQNVRNVPVMFIAELHMAMFKRIGIDAGLAACPLKPFASAGRRQVVNR
ncbi:hypothetical protein D3C72_2032320 [compost metagenome]